MPTESKLDYTHTHDCWTQLLLKFFLQLLLIDHLLNRTGNRTRTWSSGPNGALWGPSSTWLCNCHVCCSFSWTKCASTFSLPRPWSSTQPLTPWKVPGRQHLKPPWTEGGIGSYMITVATLDPAQSGKQAVFHGATPSLTLPSPCYSTLQSSEGGDPFTSGCLSNREM